MTTFRTEDDVLTLLIHLGYLAGNLAGKNKTGCRGNSTGAF